jgi:hypothetical protein
MGMQVPRGVHTHVSQESPLWDDPAGIARRVSPVGEVEGGRDRGRLSDAGSRAYAHLQSAPTQGDPSLHRESGKRGSAFG